MIQVAEPAGEGDQIRIRNVLIAKYEHLMSDPRLMDGGKAGVVEMPQVSVGDLGAERAASLKRHDADAGRPIRGNGGIHQPRPFVCVARRRLPWPSTISWTCRFNGPDLSVSATEPSAIQVSRFNQTVQPPGTSLVSNAG
jgi:hypothetical protein